jgi:ABC-2 type transport system ATP-binding protein
LARVARLAPRRAALFTGAVWIAMELFSFAGRVVITNGLWGNASAGTDGRTQSSMIEVERLSKSYGTRAAVRDVSFVVQPGEVVGLIGLNGAGKTTTLQSIAGIIRPDEGSVRIAGADLGTHPVAAKRQLAFVADEPEFFEYMTVEEHLLLAMKLYATPVRTDADPLTTFGLHDMRTQFPGELSRGMRQKLAMACVLWRSPKALVFDEPLTGLDPIGIRDTKDVIRAHAARGAAVLLSSHLLHLVQELCSRVIILDGGRVVAEHEVAALGPRVQEPLERLFVEITGTGAIGR